mmetsp:Transcript_80670/g.261450  ORF Transcript_80670/g.261450 Transcript_80670/m.261450 type:complete len:518 (+) Transcript_80670:492-2045(+)
MAPDVKPVGQLVGVAVRPREGHDQLVGVRATSGLDGVHVLQRTLRFEPQFPVRGGARHHHVAVQVAVLTGGGGPDVHLIQAATRACCLVILQLLLGAESGSGSLAEVSSLHPRHHSAATGERIVARGAADLVVAVGGGGRGPIQLRARHRRAASGVAARGLVLRRRGHSTRLASLHTIATQALLLVCVAPAIAVPARKALRRARVALLCDATDSEAELSVVAAKCDMLVVSANLPFDVDDDPIDVPHVVGVAAELHEVQLEIVRHRDEAHELRSVTLLEAILAPPAIRGRQHDGRPVLAIVGTRADHHMEGPVAVAAQVFGRSDGDDDCGVAHGGLDAGKNIFLRDPGLLVLATNLFGKVHVQGNAMAAPLFDEGLLRNEGVDVARRVAPAVQLALRLVGHHGPNVWLMQLPDESILVGMPLEVCFVQGGFRRRARHRRHTLSWEQRLRPHRKAAHAVGVRGHEPLAELAQRLTRFTPREARIVPAHRCETRHATSARGERTRWNIHLATRQRRCHR